MSVEADVQDRSHASRRPGPWLIGWGVASVALVLLLSFRRQSELIGCYLPAARRVLEGLALPGPEGWVYPPVFTLPVLPLIALPVWLARAVWCLLLVTAVTLALRWMWRALVLDAAFRQAMVRPRRFVAFVLLVLGASLGHVLSPMTYQAHDVIVLALVSAGAFQGARAATEIASPARGAGERRAGICFGLAASFKVMPVLFLPVLVAQRRWRAAFAMGCTGLLSAAAFELLTWLGTGRAHLPAWLRLASSGSDLTASGGGRWGAWNPLNQSGTGILTRLMVPTPTDRDLDHECMVLAVDESTRRVVLGCWVLGVIAALLLVAWRTARSTRPGVVTAGGSPALHAVAAAGATACAYVLVAPHASNYHFAPLMLAAAAMAAWLAARSRDATILIALGLMILIELIPGRDVLGGRLSDIKLAYGSVGLCALAGLVGAMRVMVLA